MKAVTIVHCPMLAGPSRQMFVTHGEESAAMAFQEFLSEKTGWDCVVPEYEQEVQLR